MIIKIIKYIAVFVLGAMTMASNPSLYEQARTFFNGVDGFVQDITQKEQPEDSNNSE